MIDLTQPAMPDMAAVWQNLTTIAVTWGPRILAALAILFVTHFVAKAVSKALLKLAKRPGWSRASASGEISDTVWAQSGNLVYWLIWLFGLLIALQPLGLGEVVSPLNALLNEVFGYLPNFFGAIAIFIVGLALSKIGRGVVESAVSVVRVEKLIGTKDFDDGDQKKSLVSAVGILVQMLILIPISLAALDTLGIDTVSKPIEQVLSTVLNAIPHVVASSVVLVLAWMVGRWVAAAAETFLKGMGVDNAVSSFGLGEEGLSLSRAAYHIIMIAIMLFAAIEAAQLLNFDAISQIVDEVTRLGGRVIFGVVIIVVGFLLSKLVGKMVSSMGSGSSVEANIARYATVGLAIAMGLSFMGIASNIVTLAFGLTLGAVAIASAIAFGIGGRETAHQLLQDWKASRGGATAPAKKTAVKKTDNM